MKLEETITVSVHMKAVESAEDAGKRLNKAIKKALVKEFGAADIEIEEVKISGKDMIGKIVKHVKKALEKYSTENVDVALNEETNCLYVMYHSDHDSFPITKDICQKEHANLEKLAAALDKLDVGHCW